MLVTSETSEAVKRMTAVAILDCGGREGGKRSGAAGGSAAVDDIGLANITEAVELGLGLCQRGSEHVRHVTWGVRIRRWGRDVNEHRRGLLLGHLCCRWLVKKNVSTV